MLLMLLMIIMMMVVEMKRILRILVAMMKFRTCLHTECCNVFSSTKFVPSKFVQFNNIRQKLMTHFSSCVCYLSHQAL